MAGRVIGNAGEGVGEVELWVEAVEFGGFDQRVHCGAAAAGVGTGEEIVFTTDRDAAQGTFGWVVVERQAAVIKSTAECWTASAHIAEGGGKLRFARQLARGLVGPVSQRRGDRH